MPFVAKALAPCADDLQAAHSLVAAIRNGQSIVLEDPEGCLPTEQIAAALRRTGHWPLWLRLGPEDRDPGSFLLSAITAARRCHPDIGESSLGLMRAQPGPVYGWPALFAHLGRELRECLADRGAMILEDPHDIWSRSALFPLIRTHLLPALATVAPCVLITRRTPAADAPGDWVRLREPGLRVPDAVADQVLAECAPRLGTRLRNRALAVTGGRQTVITGLQAVSAGTGEDSVAPLLMHARTAEQLLARIAGALLRHTDAEGRSGLGLVLRTGYAHPDLTGIALAGGPPPGRPWLQSLEGGWARIRPCWHRPLQAVLGRHAAPGIDVLHRMADRLLMLGADEQAVALYLQLGDQECTARTIAAIAGRLMDLGQWATLDSWLDRLPAEAFSQYPDLMYCRADIAAARGNPALAMRRFSSAASWFSARNDIAGACRSLLASSTAAADSGDLAVALARAGTARSLAEAGNLAADQMWAAWQQGRAALLSGDIQNALVSFSRAAALRPLGAGAETRPVRRAGELSQRLEGLRQQQAAHREAEAALRAAEHQALNELLASVSMHGQRDSRPSGLAWSETPAPLKPYGPSPSGPAPSAWLATQWARLRHALSPDKRAVTTCPADGARTDSVATSFAALPRVISADRSHHAVRLETAPAPVALPAATAPQRQGAAGPELAVHLLGSFSVTLDDVALDDWSGARARSLFGYLLTHREPWPPREVLMEVFWPGSAPHASRNSLNVALHGLRQRLRAVTEAPVIVYARGVYRIHPAVRLWLDVEEFDERVRRGKLLEKAGTFDRAAEAYESAAGLYRGEFLAEDPYEEWAALTRERLRLTHLDALGRLSELRFSAGQYAACANLSRRIIEQDSCREDAYRRLMRCYSRQGQPHLARLQYQACVRALAGELGVEPEPATSDLNERLRRHEPI